MMNNQNNNYSSIYVSTSVLSDDKCVVIKNNDFKVIVSYLKEDEICELIEKLQLRGIPEASLKCVLKTVIQDKHMSEKFLLDNYQYLTKEDIMIMHSSDIMSQSYADLALLMETSENK